MAVILGDRPTVIENDVAALTKAFDRIAGTVVEPMLPPGTAEPEAETPASAKTTWLSLAKKFASFGIESSYTDAVRRGTTNHEMTHQQRLAIERRREDPEQTRS
jgi:hypothetical protein